MKTTIEWFDPKDAMPKGVDEVLAIIKTNAIMQLNYSDKHKAFNASGNSEPEHAFPVKYWAYLPEELAR